MNKRKKKKPEPHTSAWMSGNETREEARARYYATKQNAKKRKRKKRFVVRPETPKTQATRSREVRRDAMKAFRTWLNSAKISELAGKAILTWGPEHDLVHRLNYAMREITEELEKT